MTKKKINYALWPGVVWRMRQLAGEASTSSMIIYLWWLWKVGCEVWARLTYMKEWPGWGFLLGATLARGKANTIRTIPGRDKSPLRRKWSAGGATAETQGSITGRLGVLRLERFNLGPTILLHRARVGGIRWSSALHHVSTICCQWP